MFICRQPLDIHPKCSSAIWNKPTPVNQTILHNSLPSFHVCVFWTVNKMVLLSMYFWDGLEHENSDLIRGAWIHMYVLIMNKLQYTDVYKKWSHPYYNSSNWVLHVQLCPWMLHLCDLSCWPTATIKHLCVTSRNGNSSSWLHGNQGSSTFAHPWAPTPTLDLHLLAPDGTSACSVGTMLCVSVQQTDVCNN